MKYSIRLDKIKCNNTKSSSRCPWGAADGVKMYAIISNFDGYIKVLESLPIPGEEDSSSFGAINGREILFNTIHVRDVFTNTYDKWEFEFDAMDDTITKIAIFGVNLGLAYIGGGGGNPDGMFGSFFSRGVDAVYGLIDDKLEKHKIKIIDGIAVKVPVSAIFKGFIDFIQSLTRERTNCRGLLFSYEAEISGSFLIQEQIKKKLSHSFSLEKNVLNSYMGFKDVIAESALTGGVTSSADYEINLTLSSVTQLKIEETTELLKQEQSGTEPVIIERNPPCALQRIDGQRWFSNIESKWTFAPEFWFGSIYPVFYIDGIKLNEYEGEISLNKQTSLPFQEASINSTVVLRYTLKSIQGLNKIYLYNRASDNNFEINVEIKFMIKGVEISFYKKLLQIVGYKTEYSEDVNGYYRCIGTKYIKEALQIRNLLEIPKDFKIPPVEIIFSEITRQPEINFVQNNLGGINL